MNEDKKENWNPPLSEDALNFIIDLMDEYVACVEVLEEQNEN